MFTITKEVYFCYGHRLMNHPGKCRHLHGHSVKAAISIAHEHLNEQGMVCDFAQVREATETFIDQTLDHNFLLHKQDPLIPLLQAQNERFSRARRAPDRGSSQQNDLPTSTSAGIQSRASRSVGNGQCQRLLSRNLNNPWGF